MKPAQIFHQYIWIINTLRACRKLTLEELNRKWQEDGVAEGNPLQRDFVGIEREREYVEMSQRRRLEIDNPLTAENYRTRIKDIDFV